MGLSKPRRIALRALQVELVRRVAPGVPKFGICCGDICHGQYEQVIQMYLTGNGDGKVVDNLGVLRVFPLEQSSTSRGDFPPAILPVEYRVR